MYIILFDKNIDVYLGKFEAHLYQKCYTNKGKIYYSLFILSSLCLMQRRKFVTCSGLYPITPLLAKASLFFKKHETQHCRKYILIALPNLRQVHSLFLIDFSKQFVLLRPLSYSRFFFPSRSFSSCLKLLPRLLVSYVFNYIFIQ